MGAFVGGICVYQRMEGERYPASSTYVVVITATTLGGGGVPLSRIGTVGHGTREHVYTAASLSPRPASAARQTNRPTERGQCDHHQQLECGEAKNPRELCVSQPARYRCQLALMDGVFSQKQRPTYKLEYRTVHKTRLSDC